MKEHFNRRFVTDISLPGLCPQKFSRIELLLMSDNAETRAEAKRLIKQGFVVWIDRFWEVPTDRETDIFERARKIEDDVITVEGGDILLFGKHTHKANRIRFWDEQIQTREQWQEALNYKAAGWIVE